MKEKKTLSTIAIILSVIAIILSAIVSLTKADILGLAGTQWILIGIVLAIYGLYLNCRNCACVAENKQQ